MVERYRAELDRGLERREVAARPGEVCVGEIAFTGQGAEYFRIWVVNLLLTLLTAGLYSPWAKVRKARYFRQNTRLDGHVFDYHGNPVAILRGRIVALVLLGAYSWAFQFSKPAGLVTVGVLCVVGPWLLMRAQQFSLSNTSFRGLRFGFDARVGPAYRAALPPLVLWLAPTVAGALASSLGWLAVIPGVAFVLTVPWMHHRIKAYQHRHAAYGDRRFTFTSATPRFYAVYAKGLGLVLLGGILPAVAMVVLVVLLRFLVGPPVSDPTVGPVVAGVLGTALVYVIGWPYLAARLQQVVWTRTRLGDIRFGTEIRPLRLFRLVLANGVLTLVSAGLYWPWAAVALARYRIECVRVEADLPLSALAAGVQRAAVSAAGVGAADVFGFDIGL